MASDREALAWLAGIFEGEGTVTISRGGSRGYVVLQISVTNTDHSIPRFFADRWGGYVSRPTTPSGCPRAKPAVRWIASSLMAARVVADLRPFIRTQRVAVKFDLALEYHATRRKGSRDPKYRAGRHLYRERMATLNRRGIS